MSDPRVGGRWLKPCFRYSSTRWRVQVGPNGCGKSTLVKLMSGEVQPVEGVINKHPHCVTESADSDTHPKVVCTVS